MSQRIHRAFDAGLCMKPQGWLPSRKPRCHEDCARILFYYGSRPFKCEFSQCERWRHGFVNRGLRDKHRVSHDLPWHCLVPGCKFAQIGFISRAMREKHLTECRQNNRLQSMFDFRDLNNDSVEPLLSDLILENRVEAVRDFIGNPNLSSETLERLFYRLRLLAAYAASGDMLDLLDHAAVKTSSTLSERPIPHDYFLEAMKGRNRSTMEYLSTWSTPLDDCPIFVDPHGMCMCQLMSMDWIEGTEIWCRWYRKRPDMDDRTTFKLAEAASEQVAKVGPLKEAAKNRGGEQQLLYIWKHPAFVHSFNDGGALATRMLRHVAEFSCSTTLAEYLLEKGAQISGRKRKSAKTALYCAAERDSFEGASMMRILLQHGADPEAEISRRGGGHQRRIRDQVGPRNARKWLGKDWDELVQETKVFRDNN